MKFSEMMELAKAGYKPAEIAEMAKLEKVADAPEEEEEIKDDTLADMEDKETPQDVQNQNDKDDDADQTDYKALYEQSQKALKEAQSANVNQNIGGTDKKDEDILADAIRGFM